MIFPMMQEIQLIHLRILHHFGGRFIDLIGQPRRDIYERMLGTAVDIL